MGIKTKTKGNIIMAVAVFIIVTVMVLAIMLGIWLDKLYFNLLIN